MKDQIAYYICTKSLDKSGLLNTLFTTIAGMHGNIVHFRQSLQKTNTTNLSDEQIIADIHMFAIWDTRNLQLKDEMIKNGIISALTHLYQEDDSINIEKDIVVIVEARKTETAIPLRDHARFKIDLFDKQQVAAKIVEVFSKRNLSVTESYYRLNTIPVDNISSDTVGRMVIFADVTENKVSLDMIQKELMEVDGVFNVQSSKRTGYYSL